MLNQCQFIGNLGAAPEIRSFSNGNRVCNLRLACTEKWKDRETGEKKEKTEWVSVDVFSEGLIKVCEQYLQKGSKVYVSGKFSTRKYQDQSGNDRYSTSIVLQGFNGTLTMLDKRGEGQDNNGGGYDNRSSGGGYDNGPSGGGYGAGGNGMDDGDSIPFAMEWR